MRIIVNGGSRKDIRRSLPNGLVLNKLSAFILCAGLKDKNKRTTVKQLLILFQAIKAYASAHPEWKLVEVRGHDGDIVEIVL